MAQIRWGILGVAGIAVKAVIPALQRSTTAQLVAIASRDIDKARTAAERFAIPRAYGSYAELIADPGIDAVYIPLPNHLHVPWTIAAAQAGKNVLCEKPIAMSAAEARTLLAVRDAANVHIAEAFMVRSHPRWLRVRKLIQEGRIGKLLHVNCHFSYYKDDPHDVRSRVDFGGGALMDIGCYAIMIARWIFGSEPLEVAAAIERDPTLHVDVMTSALLQFPEGHATFTVSGRMVPWQRMMFFGTTGRIDVEIPFNTPNDLDCRIFIDHGSDLRGGNIETIVVPAADHYVTQADQFAEAVWGNRKGQVSLDDAVANMTVIDACFKAAREHAWIRIDAEASSLFSAPPR